MARIFVVDDEQFIRKALKRVLERAGFSVELFATVPEAMQALACPPELVLTDYNLPGRDGLALAARTREVAPEVPVLVISGSIPDERIAAALRSGLIRRFISKPWDQKELVAALRAELAAVPASLADCS